MKPHDPMVRVIACPHPLSVERDRLDMRRIVGDTVAGHMRTIRWDPGCINARVYLDGELVPSAQWEYVTPLAGQSLVLRTVPMGGEGGNDLPPEN